MKTTLKRSFRRSAFSLIELIACVGIIALLALASIPAVGSLTRGSHINRSIRTLTAMMEKARQEACAGNTFTWIALADAQPGAGRQDMKVVMFSSKSGEDPIGWGAVPVDITSNPDLSISGEARSLSGVKLTGPGEIPISGMPVCSSPGTFAAVNWDVKIAGETRRFTHAIRYTPTGQATVKSGMYRTVEFGLLPTQGNETNVAVIRTIGTTGKSSVFRPQ